MAASHWDVFLKKKRTHEASPDDDGPSAKRQQVGAAQPASSYQMNKRTRELFPNLSQITTPAVERDTPVKKKVQGSPIKIKDIVEKYRKHKNNFINSSTKFSVVNKGKKALSGAGASNSCVSTANSASTIKDTTNDTKTVPVPHIATDVVKRAQCSPMLSKNCDVGPKVKDNHLAHIPEDVRSDKTLFVGELESKKTLLLLAPRQAIAASKDITIIRRGSFQETSNHSQLVNCKNRILPTEKSKGNEINHSSFKLNLNMDAGIELKNRIHASDSTVPELQQDDESETCKKITICSAGHKAKVTESKYTHIEKENNNNLLIAIPETESLTAKEGINIGSKGGDLLMRHGQASSQSSSECLSKKSITSQVEVETDSKGTASFQPRPKAIETVKQSKFNISEDTRVQSSLGKPHLKGLLSDAGKLSSKANVDDGLCDKKDRSFEQRLLQVKENQLTKWKSCFLDNKKADGCKKTDGNKTIENINNNNNDCVQGVKEICSNPSGSASTDHSETDHTEVAACKVDNLEADKCSSTSTQTANTVECVKSPSGVMSEKGESEDEEGELLKLSDQEVEVKEEVIDDETFVDKMNLGEADVQTILSKYSDIIPHAIRYLNQYSRGQVPRSTGAVTITPVSKKPSKEACQPKEACSPYEVEIVTSTNSFSITPIIRPKVEPKSEPTESTNSDSRSSSSVPSAGAQFGDVVVSDREEYSDESSDDDLDTDAVRHLQLVRTTRHDIGLTKYKPAVIKMASSGKLVPPGLKSQSSFHIDSNMFNDTVVSHKVPDGTISSKVSVESSLKAAASLGLKQCSALKSNTTEPVPAGNFCVRNKLGIMHKLKGYAALGQPFEEPATAISVPSTPMNARGNCPPSVNVKSLAVSSRIETELQPEQSRISCQGISAVSDGSTNALSGNTIQTNSTSPGVIVPLQEHPGSTAPVAPTQKPIYLNVPIYSPRFRTILAKTGSCDLPFPPSIASVNSSKNTKPCRMTATSAASTPSSFEAVSSGACAVLQNTLPQYTPAVQPQSTVLPDSNILVPNNVMTTSNQSGFVTSKTSLTSVQSGLSGVSAEPVRLLGFSNTLQQTQPNLHLPTSLSNTLLSTALTGSINNSRTQPSLLLATSFPNTQLNTVVTSAVNISQTQPNLMLPSFSNTVVNPAVTASVNSRQIQPTLLLPTSFSNTILSSAVSGSPNVPQTQSCLPVQTAIVTSSQTTLSAVSPAVDQISSPQPPIQAPVPLAGGMTHTFLFQPASLPGAPKPPLLLIKANSLEDVQNLLKNKKIVIRPNAQPSISFEGLPPTSTGCALSSAPSVGEQSQVTTATSALSDIVTNTVPSNPEAGSNTGPSNPESGSNTVPSNPESGSNTVPSNPESGSNAVPFNPEAGSNTVPCNPEAGSNTVPSNPEAGSGMNGPAVSLSLTNAVSSLLTSSNNNSINSSAVKTYSKKASAGGKVASKPLYKNEVLQHTGPLTKAYDVFPTIKKCKVVLKPCDIVSLDDGESTVNLSTYFRKLANVPSNSLQSSSRKTYAKCTTRGYSVKHTGIIGKTSLLRQRQRSRNPAIDMSPPSSSQTSSPHNSLSLSSSINSMLTDDNTHIVPSLPKGLLPSTVAQSNSPPSIVPSNVDHTITDRLECNTESVESNANLLESNTNSIDSTANSLESVVDPLESKSDSLESVADPLESKVDYLESKADPLESKADPLESKADPLESKADPLESKADPLESKADPLESKVDPLESKVDLILPNDEPLECNNGPLVSCPGTVDHINSVDNSTLNKRSNCSSTPTETHQQVFTADSLEESEENPLSIVKIEPVSEAQSAGTPTPASQSRPNSVQSNTSSGVGSSSNFFVVLNQGYSGRSTPSGVGSTPPVVDNTPSGVSITSSGVSITSSGVSITPSGVSITPSGVSITPSGVSITPSGVSITPSGVSITSSGVSITPSGNGSTKSSASNTTSGDGNIQALGCSCGPLHSCAICHEAKNPSSLPSVEDCSCSTSDITEKEISLILQSIDPNSSKPRLSVKSTASLTAPASESDLPSASNTIPPSTTALPSLAASLHCQKNHRTAVTHNIRITPAVKSSAAAPEHKWEGAIKTMISSADAPASTTMSPPATVVASPTANEAAVVTLKAEGVMEVAQEEFKKAKFASTYAAPPQFRFGPIYMDYNATTPVATKVADLIDSTMRLQWGNPSSSHQFGREAQETIALARNRIAAMLSARHENIVFTSGGTEANNLAIHSAIKHYRGWVSKNAPEGHQLHHAFKNPHVITSNIEHDSVRRVLNCYEDLELTVVSWEQMPHGVVDNIKANTCLITVMLANNETGIMLPVAHISRLVSEEVERLREAERLFRVLIHTDASQCVGKVPVEVDALGVDYLTLTGHKFYGPRFGALYIRENNQGFLPVYPQFCGGGQERGIRPGTENTPMIAGLGLACELVYSNIYEYAAHMKKMRNYLERLLKRHFQHNVKLNCITPCLASDPERCSTRHLECKTEGELVFPRLPNTTSIAFCYSLVTGAKLLQLCPNLLCSVGAACHSEDSIGYENSVLKQHGVCSFHAARTLRLSVGRETTFMDVDSAVMQITMAVRTLISNKL